MTLATARFHGHRSVDSRSILRDVLGYAPAHDGVRTVEIERVENGFRVEMPVPGYAAADLTITLDQNMLAIAGEKKSRLQRTLVLPEEIDPESIVADVENGLLTLTMSVHAKPQPRVIRVSSGGPRDAAEAPLEAGAHAA